MAEVPGNAPENIENTEPQNSTTMVCHKAKPPGGIIRLCVWTTRKNHWQKNKGELQASYRGSDHPLLPSKVAPALKQIYLPGHVQTLGNQDSRVSLSHEVNGGPPWRFNSVWEQSGTARRQYNLNLGVINPTWVTDASDCPSSRLRRQRPLHDLWIL